MKFVTLILPTLLLAAITTPLAAQEPALSGDVTIEPGLSVGPLKLGEMQNFVAQRPVYTVLSTARFAEITGHPPRPWREAVSEYIRTNYLKK